MSIDSIALDPRLHAYRDGIAADHLRGQVEAERFVSPMGRSVAVPVTDIVDNPGANGRTSQALYGEQFNVYDQRDGWAWGQLATDDYVGWVKIDHLSSDPPNLSTHRVSALITRATPGSIKSLGFGPLPMGSMVRAPDAPTHVLASSALFLETSAGAIPLAHLQAIGERVTDWVASAELYIGAPYVWGGRSALGLDCSALVQLSLAQANVPCLRDSDMQEASLGEAIDRSHGLQRGDLVFWPGHVGVMLSEEIILHANAWHMAVASEPLSETEARIGPARVIKRLQ